MKCPKCGKQPISKLHFSLTSFPSNINCMHCDAELKPNGVIQGVIYTGYILGGILGFAVILLGGAYGWSWGTTALVFLLGVIVIALPLELFGWKNGRYELVKKSSP